MNVSIEVKDLIIDAEIRQWEFEGRKGSVSSQICISTCCGNYIFLNFTSPESLTDFCKKHNFPLEDKRNVAKAISVDQSQPMECRQ